MRTKENINSFRKKFIKTWMYYAAGVILLFLIGYLFILTPFAYVTINVQSRGVSDTSTLTANLNNSGISSSSKTIPLYYTDQNESSSSSVNTTGSNTEYHNATGTITIEYTVNTLVKIPAGTLIIANNVYTCQFSVNSEVDLDPNAQTATAALTAVNNDQGQNCNITSGTKLTFNPGSFNPQAPDTIFISNTYQNFIGGAASQKVQVVSQSDHDGLLKSLEQQLYAKGQSDLSSKLSNDETSVSQTMKNSDVTTSFDSNVGDKASILNLSLTTKTSILSYKNSDFKSYAQSILANQISSGEALSNISTNITFQKYDDKSGDVTYSVVSNASTTPVLNITKIASHISKGTQSSATSYIKTFNGVKSVKINMVPGWIGIFGFMPFRSSNIKITINTD